MKDYNIMVRTWAGQYVTSLEVSASSYMKALEQLKSQYSNHRFTILGVSPCELDITCIY